MSVRVTPGPVGSAATRARAEETQRWRSEQLALVRAAADKWRAALLGVMGLITVVAVVKGRDTIMYLRPDYRIAVGVCLLLALVCAATGSFWGMRAAFGMPRVFVLRRNTGPPGYDLPLAARATVDLRRAVYCTYLTLGLLTAGVALTWYGPLSPPAFVSVTSIEGIHVCGSLVSADNHQLIVKTGSQQTVMPTSELRVMTLKPSC